MAAIEEVQGRLVALGFSETDAEALADCLISNKSLSWVNTDPVSGEMLDRLAAFMKEEGYQIRVSVQEVPNRGKYIWDVEGKD
ncbi:MAG: hypothetical protein QXH30_01005 [Candidatus Bilamarchaeaceae archaeon]